MFDHSIKAFLLPQRDCSLTKQSEAGSIDGCVYQAPYSRCKVVLITILAESVG